MMGRLDEAQKQIVLVVEDEPLLRMMAVDLVEVAGFEALEAADAHEAMALLESRADIRIVFTDIDMPGGMDGLMLAAAVRNRWPPIAIIITSGHIKLELDMIPAHAEFFAKPYDTRKVTQTLQSFASTGHS